MSYERTSQLPIPTKKLHRRVSIWAESCRQTRTSTISNNDSASKTIEPDSRSRFDNHVDVNYALNCFSTPVSWSESTKEWTTATCTACPKENEQASRCRFRKTSTRTATPPSEPLVLYDRTRTSHRAATSHVARTVDISEDVVVVVLNFRQLLQL